MYTCHICYWETYGLLYLLDENMQCATCDKRPFCKLLKRINHKRGRLPPNKKALHIWKALKWAI